MKALFAAFTLMAAPAFAAAPADSGPAEVKRVFMSGIEAFNAHDLPRFMSQFDPELQMFTPTGWLRGAMEVQARFFETFTNFPAVRMEIDGLQARSVSPEAVTVDFRWKVYPKGAGPAFHGVGSGVYVRRSEGWREVLEHETVTRTDPELAQRR